MSWANEKPLSMRQRLAVKLLLIAIKIVDPYQFKHEFEKEWDVVEKLLADKPEAKK